MELLAQQYYSNMGVAAPRPIFIGDRLWYVYIHLFKILSIYRNIQTAGTHSTLLTIMFDNIYKPILTNHRHS